MKKYETKFVAAPPVIEDLDTLLKSEGQIGFRPISHIGVQGGLVFLLGRELDEEVDQADIEKAKAEAHQAALMKQFGITK